MPAPWVSPRFLLTFSTLAAILLAGPAVRAGRDAQPEPAHVASVDGNVMIDRDGQADAADVNVPIVPGDRLRTSVGRVEIMFPDGSVLDVDESSSLELLSPALIRLTGGRMLLTVRGVGDPARAARYQIDTPAAIVRTEGSGQYRVAVSGPSSGEQTELEILRGSATLVTDRGSTTLGAGRRLMAMQGGSVSYPEPFNSARLDSFDQWIADRRDARVGSANSARYLPDDLQVYSGALAQAGTWQYNEPDGYVWYPSVEADWQPYYDGYWSPIPAYGWTWIGAGSWAWPTHHYGRWGHAHGSWYWKPGRTWGAGWVSWSGAPGYVSWCPLGVDGRPVGAFSSAGPGTGWVVVPRHSFGSRRSATPAAAIEARALPRATTLEARPTVPVAASVWRAAPRPQITSARQSPAPDVIAGRPRSADVSRAPGNAERVPPARPAPWRSEESGPHAIAPRAPEPTAPHVSQSTQPLAPIRPPAFTAVAAKPSSPAVHEGSPPAEPRVSAPVRPPATAGSGAHESHASAPRTASPDHSSSGHASSSAAPHASGAGSRR